MEERNFVGLIAYNKEGKFLMQQRTSDAPRDPNKWDLFGGGAEEDESPEEALERELMEELELKIENPTFYIKTNNVEDGIRKIRHYFYSLIDQDSEYLKQKQHEGQNLGFFSPEELKSLDIRVHQIEPLRRFINDKKF